MVLCRCHLAAQLWLWGRWRALRPNRSGKSFKTENSRPPCGSEPQRDVKNTLTLTADEPALTPENTVLLSSATARWRCVIFNVRSPPSMGTACTFNHNCRGCRQLCSISLRGNLIAGEPGCMRAGEKLHVHAPLSEGE